MDPLAEFKPALRDRLAGYGKPPIPVQQPKRTYLQPAPTKSLLSGDFYSQRRAEKEHADWIAEEERKLKMRDPNKRPFAYGLQNMLENYIEAPVGLSNMVMDVINDNVTEIPSGLRDLINLAVENGDIILNPAKEMVKGAGGLLITKRFGDAIKTKTFHATPAKWADEAVQVVPKKTFIGQRDGVGFYTIEDPVEAYKYIPYENKGGIYEFDLNAPAKNILDFGSPIQMHHPDVQHAMRELLSGDAYSSMERWGKRKNPALAKAVVDLDMQKNFGKYNTPSYQSFPDPVTGMWGPNSELRNAGIKAKAFPYGFNSSNSNVIVVTDPSILSKTDETFGQLELIKKYLEDRNGNNIFRQ